LHAPPRSLQHGGRSAPGNEALRRAIARRYAGEGMAVDPQQIIITTGAMEALSSVFRC
jgi:DNA-binding transcriptional MocR family regulator